MTVANLSDLSKDPIYAELLVKIHLLEQRNEHLQQQIVQTNTRHDQLQQLVNKTFEENHKLYLKYWNSSKNKSGSSTGYMDKRAKA